MYSRYSLGALWFSGVWVCGVSFKCVSGVAGGVGCGKFWEAINIKELRLEMWCFPCVKVRRWEYRLFRCVWVCVGGSVIDDKLEQGVVLYTCGLFGDECSMLMV
jgi:hypothetical protein